MLKRLQKRIAALCTCGTLMVAAPMSLDGCQGVGGLIGGGSATEIMTQNTATAVAGEDGAAATATSSTSVTQQQGGFVGGGFGYGEW